MNEDNTEINYQTVNQDCCCFNMRKVSRAITQLFDHNLESSGIRVTQFTLLVELAYVKSKTLTEIAQSLVMDRTTLTRNLKPLEKLGFISIVQQADKRSKGYVLTEKGHEILKKSYPLWKKAQNKIISGLDDERYKKLLLEMNHLLSITENARKSY